MSSKQAGRQRFAGAEWAAARDEFAAALEEEPGDPEALDGLGQSLWWLGEEGVALLDEAMTVALGGETSDPMACGDACCTTLVVCDGLADLNRAAEWCEAVVEFTERRRFLPVQSWCRGIYGAVLVRAGDWERGRGGARRGAPAGGGPPGRRPRAAARCARRAAPAPGAQ